MRAMYLLPLGLLACGGGSETPDAPPGQVIDARLIDAPPGPPADAAPDAAVATCVPQNGTTVTTEITAPAGTFLRPVLVTSPPGDRRLFVVEQAGLIRIIDQGNVIGTPFLDLRDDSGGPVDDTENEQGLTGLAFHPDFATNKLFYVFYTKADNDEIIAEYHASSAWEGDESSARILLTNDDPYWNHNGGHLEFGPNDGFLYIGIGDGGSGDDPQENGQKLSTFMGKLLRIDVDTRTGSKQYGIPASNPYASSADGANDPRPEIWAYGLRNPYRWSFDRQTGDLYIGDVGQDAQEEFDFQPASSTGGENYGWDDVEGTLCHEPSSGCSFAGKVAPVHTYTNAGAGTWCSAIGGSVYRGSCFPDLVGKYFYSDYCVRQIWSWNVSNPSVDTMVTAALPGGVTSIHGDALGELYVTVFDGSIRHIIAQ